MSLARRVRAGIALHAGVNVAFALGAVLSAAGGPAAVASDAPLAPLSSGPPSGLPIHSVTTMPVHPLLAGPSTTTEATEPPPVATTTAAPATTAATRPPQQERRATTTTLNHSTAGLPRGTVREVSSTGYCLTGVTASGRRVADGMAAMNGVPLGTRWRVDGGPRDGQVFEVTDRIGHGTEFDIWFPTCDAAVDYGRRTITVELIG